MLIKKLRFHGHGGLRYLYKNADAYRSRYFTLKIIKNPHRKHSRYAVVVSKKVHKSAVGRNRIRRRVYEILRAEHQSINGVYDIAVIVTNGEALMADFADLQQAITESLAKANVYAGVEKTL